MPRVLAASAHIQPPLMHGCRFSHAIPQPPQFLGSVLVSTHAPKHVTLVVHMTPQLVPSQVAFSNFAAVHTEHCSPHASSDVLLTQRPSPQSCWPDGHEHTPVEQTLPPVQIVPHVPQLELSVRRSTQLPEQLEKPGSRHLRGQHHHAYFLKNSHCSLVALA